MKKFYSNGKLLITGEYAVLDGALSLALPTKSGQFLTVKDNGASKELRWKSIDNKGNTWFEGSYDIKNLKELKTTDNEISKTLTTILCEAKRSNPSFLMDANGYDVETRLTFPRDWGLGSSSTLLNNIAQWATADPYRLLWNAFSGSGYDIACARHNTPVLYQLKKNGPSVRKIDFDPGFKSHLYFIHLNKKQNSREGIAQYRKQCFNKRELICALTEITKKITVCNDLSQFEQLVTDHETILSNVLRIPKVKDSLFPDYKGAIKSLGAWGGDFVLATGNEKTPAYFRDKGYGTVLSFNEMILK